MKATDYIVRFLIQRGVRHVFEVSGGMITHLLDSCNRLGAPNVISVRHEQAAGFAAEGWARMTSVPGVALATSGPGATNLLTAIGSCYFDSTPAVFITGQVNRHERKGTRDIRQLGFQETDIVAIARPLTKAALQVETPESLPELLNRAFAMATAGRPGPVLLDIPMDVQRSEIAVSLAAADCPTTAAAPKAGLAEDVDVLLTTLGKAERPLVLAGGGVRCSGAIQGFREVVDALGVPVVHSLMGIDVLPFQHPLRVGMIGTYGNRWANLAMGRSDLLLVLGSRLDIRQTGADVAAFQSGRTIFQVDVHAGEMNQRVRGCQTICAHLDPFLHTLRSRISTRGRQPDRADWSSEIASLRAEWPDTRETQGSPGINPNAFMHALSKASTAAAAFAVDVGQHQMWAAQSLELTANQRFLTSGGMGSMGFALPAAIGAAFACAPRPSVVIAGDGGFQHNIHELQTIAHHRLPVKMVVMNNQCHGMVRQFQESYFESRFQSTTWGYSAPDFARVAAAYDIPAWTISSEDDVAGGIAELWRDPAGPALLQTMISQSTPIFPKIAFGRPFTDMEPQAKPTEMEGT